MKALAKIFVWWQQLDKENEELVRNVMIVSNLAIHLLIMPLPCHFRSAVLNFCNPWNPEMLVAVNSPVFTSEELDRFTKQNEICYVKSAPYIIQHPTKRIKSAGRLCWLFTKGCQAQPCSDIIYW